MLVMADTLLISFNWDLLIAARAHKKKNDKGENRQLGWR